MAKGNKDITDSKLVFYGLDNGRLHTCLNEDVTFVTSLPTSCWSLVTNVFSVLMTCCGPT